MAVAAFVEQVHAAEVVGRLRHTDAEVVEALLDPASFTAAGRVRLDVIAKATGQGRVDVARALEVLRAEAAR